MQIISLSLPLNCSELLIIISSATEFSQSVVRKIPNHLQPPALEKEAETLYSTAVT